MQSFYNGGAYIRGLISGIKKGFEMNHGSVD